MRLLPVHGSLLKGVCGGKNGGIMKEGTQAAALLSKGSGAARAPARLILASLVVSRTNSVQYNHAPYIRCTSCRPAEQAGDDGNGDDCVVTMNSYATFEVISTPPVGIPRLT